MHAGCNPGSLCPIASLPDVLCVWGVVCGCVWSYTCNTTSSPLDPILLFSLCRAPHHQPEFDDPNGRPTIHGKYRLAYPASYLPVIYPRAMVGGHSALGPCLAIPRSRALGRAVSFTAAAELYIFPLFPRILDIYFSVPFFLFFSLSFLFLLGIYRPPCHLSTRPHANYIISVPADKRPLNILKSVSHHPFVHIDPGLF
ncbi:hypothetical protein F4777DRAFT_211548 [Nemania sp. FL0916]|nr:hypothetical protein F4777DRAFT_211548 [Nemania sp. FL0916]